MVHIPSLTWCSWVKHVNLRNAIHALSEFGQLWKDKHLLLVFNLGAAGPATLPAT
jgi:hypothetical protein